MLISSKSCLSRRANTHVKEPLSFNSSEAIVHPARVSPSNGFSILLPKFSSSSISRSLVSTLVALATFTAAASPGLTLPVSTQETLDHAAALKSAPTYREFPKELDSQIVGKDCKDPYRGNMMEWNSAHPKNVFLICIHAWGLSAREFDGFGKEMASRGFESTALDVRGFGLNRDQDGMKTIDLKLAIDDISQILAKKRKSDPEKKLIVVGESMGGALALKVAAAYPDLVDGVVCSAPAWRIFSLKKITMRGLVDQVFGEPGLAAKSVATMASSDPKLHKQWLSDNVYRMNYSVSEAFAYYRLMQSTPQNAMDIKGIPILVVQGIDDHLSKPDASVKLFKKLKTKRKQLAIVLGGEHLVFEENQLKPLLASFLEDWIAKLLPGKRTFDLTPQMVVVGDPSKLGSSEIQNLERLKVLAGVRPESKKTTTAALKRESSMP